MGAFDSSVRAGGRLAISDTRNYLYGVRKKKNKKKKKVLDGQETCLLVNLLTCDLLIRKKGDRRQWLALFG